MPHGIEGARVRPLVRGIDRYFFDYLPPLNCMSDSERVAQDEKHPPLAYVDFRQLCADLLGERGESVSEPSLPDIDKHVNHLCS